MGNTLSYITGHGELKFKQISTQTEFGFEQTSTQTEINQRETSVQTAVTFSERLTHNNTQDIGSSEIFEEICEICDTGEKKAVGVCKNCRQYMCFSCCKIHEKMAATKNHTINSKQEFGKEMKPNLLYSQNLAPIGCYFFKKDPNVANWIKIGMIHAINSDNFLFCIPTENSVGEIISIGEKSELYSTTNVMSKYSSAQPTPNCCEDSNPKCSKIGFFVFVFILQNMEEWVKETTVYKYCSDHYSNFTEAFKLHGICHSVVLFNGGLALSVYIKTGFSNPDWHIRLVDFQGNLTKQICYDENREPLFKSPSRLASSHSGDILFVSDNELNRVIALDKHGQTLFKFTHELISSPLGITCDEENNVYVACGKTVVQIERDGKTCRAILSSTDSTEDITVVDVCYNKSSRILAVAENSPKATIFKFLP